MATSTALRRLHRDLKQLKEEPIVGANAEPFGDKMMTWYGIVMGVEGTPYSGIPIRFCLEFSDDYPNSAPNAFFDTEVAYEGGAKFRDASGRYVVCLNIFGNFANYHDEWASDSAGWSPTYTVKTILLSMQALMLSDGMLSTLERDIQNMTESALQFECKITGHRGSDRSTWFPQVITDQEEANQIIEQFGKGKYDLLRDFYICYVNKVTARDGSALGYGVNIDNPKNGILSSPCEYLSCVAFNEGNRRGTTNQVFTDWIPIIIHSKHWEPLKPLFLKSVNSIAGKIQNIRNNADESTKVFKVCSSIMNTLVVEIMNNKENKSANDKFINGYFAFYRLLVLYASTEPKFIRYVEDSLQKFIQDPRSRTKAVVPNLGELLIFLTLSQKYNWSDIAQVFLQECDTRNVFWYIIGNQQTPQENLHPELANQNILAGRSKKVFDATEVSRNLVMFQVKFAQVAKNVTLEIMDVNRGLAPEELREDLKEVYVRIISVQNWDHFYDWLELPRVTEAKRDRQLAEAVQRSAAVGYHGREAYPRRQNRY